MSDGHRDSQPAPLLDRFDAWRENRARLCGLEEAGTPPKPDEWEASDEEGCNLAAEMAATLLQLLPTLAALDGIGTELRQVMKVIGAKD